MNCAASDASVTSVFRFAGLCACVVAGCTLDDPSIRLVEETGCSPENCLRDPYAHCVHLDDCETTHECPGGTFCSSESSSGEQNLKSQPKTCRPIQNPRDGSTALTNGFRARELVLQKDSLEGEPAVYSATLPTDSALVFCALFGCLPEFVHVGRVDGEARYAMSNFDQCVLGFRVRAAEQASEGTRFRFEVGSTSRYLPPFYDTCRAEGSNANDGMRVAAASAFNFATRGEAPIVSELSAGCWVLDATHVSHATRLLRLAFDEVPLMMTTSSCPAGPRSLEEEGDSSTACSRAPVSLLGVDDCAVANRDTDGLNCFPTVLGAFGTCRAGDCLPRCRERSDCVNIGYRCCDRNEGRALGVCTPECSVGEPLP